jgi:hypothetical protein
LKYQYFTLYAPFSKTIVGKRALASGNKMWVFIKGIPTEISVKGLHKLINRQLSPLWSIMPISGVRIEKSRILKIKHIKSNAWEHYGLVFINPSHLAHAVIGRLNNSKLKGKRLSAHPYVMRQRSRDRRRHTVISTEQYPGERRVNDRRRGNLVSQLSDCLG